MSIYGTANIVAPSLPLANTPKTIWASFLVAGIYLFNRDIFPEEEFLLSYSAGRPDTQYDFSKNEEAHSESCDQGHDKNLEIEPRPGSSKGSISEQTPGKVTLLK